MAGDMKADMRGDNQTTTVGHQLPGLDLDLLRGL
jgi:hypothetical protein